MSTNPYENYLHDVLASLVATAREAKADLSAIRAQQGRTAGPFEAGRSQAYYEVCSLLVSQLEAFGINRRRVGLAEDFDIDKVLL